MKILNRKDFLNLPSGTIFSEYLPCNLYGLFVKEDTCGDNDYNEIDLISSIELKESEDYCTVLEGGNFKMDYKYSGRNGHFEDEQLYAVYEQKDINKLIEYLKKCKGI